MLSITDIIIILVVTVRVCRLCTHRCLVVKICM